MAAFNSFVKKAGKAVSNAANAASNEAIKASLNSEIFVMQRDIAGLKNQFGTELWPILGEKGDFNDDARKIFFDTQKKVQ